MTTTTNAKEFSTNSVKLVDNAIVINFTSDGVEKTKTMPLTEKGLSLKDWLAKIFAMPEYNPRNIRRDVKEWWVLHDCVIELAEEARKNEAVVNDAFAALGLTATESADPIDSL